MGGASGEDSRPGIYKLTGDSLRAEPGSRNAGPPSRTRCSHSYRARVSTTGPITMLFTEVRTARVAISTYRSARSPTASRSPRVNSRFSDAPSW